MINGFSLETKDIPGCKSLITKFNTKRITNPVEPIY